MIKIIDPRDFKTYKVNDLKIIYHDIPDPNGELINTKCVEYTILGHNHEWGFWMLFEDFEKANSKIASTL